MPSFDVVSEVDGHELSNAVGQASREISNRFDFRGVDASFQIFDDHVLLKAPSDFQVQQMMSIMKDKLAKRQLDLRVLDFQAVESSLHEATQRANICQGISTDQAKQLVKLIKETKLKVQASIQGDKLRVVGKKRNDLQEVIAVLKDFDLPLPLQYNNFRD